MDSVEKKEEKVKKERERVQVHIYKRTPRSIVSFLDD